MSLRQRPSCHWARAAVKSPNPRAVVGDEGDEGGAGVEGGVGVGVVARVAVAVAVAAAVAVAVAVVVAVVVAAVRAMVASTPRTRSRGDTAEVFGCA